MRKSFSDADSSKEEAKYLTDCTSMLRMSVPEGYSVVSGGKAIHKRLGFASEFPYQLAILNAENKVVLLIGCAVKQSALASLEMFFKLNSKYPDEYYFTDSEEKVYKPLGVVQTMYLYLIPDKTSISNADPTSDFFDSLSLKAMREKSFCAVSGADSIELSQEGVAMLNSYL